MTSQVILQNYIISYHYNKDQNKPKTPTSRHKIFQIVTNIDI